MHRHLSTESSADTERGLAAMGAELGRPMCPRCLGGLNRVPRSSLDRLISLVVPVRRYRCRALACAWKGALRNSRFTLEAGDNIKHYVNATRIEGR
jgi:hypothetical protein